MSLIKCAECQHEISSQAVACPNCGHPLGEPEKEKQTRLTGAWHSVNQSKTPINVFALAMMTCAAILGGSATQVDNVCDLTAFTYTLHIFLAISGMFFVILLFARKGMYHPEDLLKAKEAGMADLGFDKPLIAAVLIGIMMTGYALYQSDFNDNAKELSLEKLKMCATTVQ